MKRLKIHTSEAVPGMIVAEDVYTYNNQLILSIGASLTDKMITRLKFYSINELYIKLAEPDVSQSPIFSKIPDVEIIYSDKVRSTPEFKNFSNQLSSAVSDFKRSFDSIIKADEPINTKDLTSQVLSVLTTARNSIHLFDMLHCSREFDDQTYTHSINVAVICAVMGQWLHMSKNDIEVLMLCGLLHDIGKSKVPDAIMNKPSTLTDAEYSTVKMHPIQGFTILQDQNIDIRIKRCALMHHERCDGSGYPSKLKKHQIDPFAKIVAIADVYDAMTSARVYRGPLCPFEVVHLFETEGLLKYDPKYILVFLEGIVQTYLHNQVHLSNGLNGEIVMINKLALSRPIVRVDTHFIDLSREPDIYIQSII